MRKTAFALLFVMANIICCAQEVKITHNLPESAKPGQELEEEITITKGIVAGFAKFQCDVPIGYSVVEKDIKGGTFTFENQRAKIVWVAIPADASFTFKIKIEVAGNATGSSTIGMKFFYLENNVKKEVEIPAHTLKITEGAAVATHTTTEPVKKEEPAKKEESFGSLDDVQLATGETVKGGEAVKTVAVETVNPVKPATTTPPSVKTEEKVAHTEPVHTTTTPVTTTHTEPVTTTPVTTTHTEPAHATTHTETKVAEVKPVETKLAETKTVATEKVTKEVAVAKTTAPEKAKVAEPKTSPAKTTNTSTASKAGLIFKVQIGAYTGAPDKSKYAGMKVDVVKEDGMNKVYSGHFKTYNDAASHRDELTSKGLKGFVVKFQDGVRLK